MGNDEMFEYGPTSGGLKVFVVHDNAILNSVSMGRCDVVGGTSPTVTGLANCQDFLIASSPASPTWVTGGSFATMSIDRAGNLYVVWEQAPGARSAITGNTPLMYATSSDEGQTWTTRSLPTPGLLNNVFAWIAAGDPGSADVAWYGTSKAWATGNTGGPDSISRDWGLYLTQTLDNGVSWSPPALASEHFSHRGTVQTVMGGQTGNRSIGDFLQLRIGAQGEANISYADSNDIDSFGTPEAMFVRQNSGPSVLNSIGTVNLPAAPANCAADVNNDATFDANGSVAPTTPTSTFSSPASPRPTRHTTG